CGGGLRRNGRRRRPSVAPDPRRRARRSRARRWRDGARRRAGIPPRTSASAASRAPGPRAWRPARWPRPPRRLRGQRGTKSAHALVPGAVLHRRREPDALVVLLQHLLALDFVARAHPSVLRLGRARVVAAVEIRRRDQATDARAAAGTGVERRILYALPRLVDDAAALTLV